MKKFSWLMSLLFVAAFVSVGCDNEVTPDTPKEVTFEVSINDTDKQFVDYSITPSDDNVDYVAVVRKSLGLSEYDTDASLVAALGEELNFADYVVKGTVNNVVVNGLDVNTAYSLLVFAVDVNNGYALTSKVSRTAFRTDAIKKSDCSFVVDTTIENTEATFIVSPSNRELGWSFMVMDQMEYLQYTDSFGEYKYTDDDLVKSDLVAKIETFVSEGGSVEDAVKEYVKVSNQRVVYSNLAPNTEFVFLVAAVEVIGSDVWVTSDVTVGRFTSGDTPMEAADFTLTASEVGAYGFVLNVETTNPDVYYFPTIAFPGSFNEAAQIAEINSLFEQQYQLLLIKYKDNPSVVTNELVLEESLYFSKGAKSFTVQNIPPQTEVMGAIFTMRPSSGKVAKVYTFDNLVTTAAASYITPSISVVGVYSGDEENGQVFGDASATAGRAIVVAESSNFDGASKVFAVLGERDRTDTMTSPFTDANVLWYYDNWVEVNLSAPYTFHVANWDAQAFLFVYAKDANGIEGGVGRTSYTPSIVGEHGSIDELMDYYNQAVTRSAVPVSLVVNM